MSDPGEQEVSGAPINVYMKLFVHTEATGVFVNAKLQRCVKVETT